MKLNLLKQRILSWSLIIIGAFALITFSSCGKEKTDKTTDNYYIRYTITGNGAYGRFSNWTATTPQGTYTNNGYQTRSWSQTYGPIKKGFKGEVRIGNSIGNAPTIDIHVSKNSEPFALKVTATGNYASYTINF